MIRKWRTRPLVVAFGVVVAAVALVSVSCGDSPRERATPAGEVPADAELIVLGPGTPIAAGFVVPDGAVLLAAPLPEDDSARDDAPWVAHLRPWDPVSTFTDLVTQAQDMGFELGSSMVDPCYAVPDERTLAGREHPAPFEPFPDGVEPKSITCTATGYRETDARTEQVDINTEQFLGRENPTSTGSLSVGPLAPGAERRSIDAGQPDLQPLVPTQVRPSSTEIPMEAPDLEPGDRFDPSKGADGPTLITGSRLAAPLNAVCSGGFFAALDVTGDPDDVFAGYLEQIRDAATNYGTTPETSSTTLFGRRIQRAWATIDDASSTVTATMVIGLDEEPTRLLLEQCNG